MRPTSRCSTSPSRQPRVQVIDSVLSEEAVMGFEYGYSTTDPNSLVDLGGAVRRLRQRRAGDHRPVHQLRRGQVGALLRPHAVPAARLRGRRARSTPRRAWSASCSCAPRTTCRCACPRRRRRCSTCCAGRCCQPFRKPLIVMTPKSLLRHELSVSALEDLSRGSFARVIDEVDDLPAAQVRRVVFCSGKVYFDLLKARRKEERRDVALVRIEQLYPFPGEEYQAALGALPERARDRLVPGGAAEPGRLVPDPPPPAGVRSPDAATCCMPVAPPRRHRPPASARSTSSSSRRSSRRRCMPRPPKIPPATRSA